MSNNEVRREAVDIAVIMLISTFLFTVGAVFLAVGQGFVLGAIPDIVEKSENLRGTPISSTMSNSTISILESYSALATYSLQLSILGTAMIVGGLGLGIVLYARMRRRILRP